RHQRVNLAFTTGLLGNEDGVTFRLHPGITHTPGHHRLPAMDKHALGKLALGGFNRAAKTPALAYANHRIGGYFRLNQSIKDLPDTRRVNAYLVEQFGDVYA